MLKITINFIRFYIGDMKANSCKTILNHWVMNLEKSTALTKNLKGNNYVQLATIDLHGLPSCRTVVYRGSLPCMFDGIGTINCLKMVTDGRSRKVEHLEVNCAAELVWWLPYTSEQYIFSGKMYAVGEKEICSDLLDARSEMWSKLSDAAQQQFHSPYLPGSLYSEPTEQKHGDLTPIRDPLPNEGKHVPPNTFFMLLLIPEKVKYLRLTDNYSQLDTLVKAVADLSTVSFKPIKSDDQLVETEAVWNSIRIHP